MRVLFGVAAAAWLVLLVGWLSLHWLILPHIDNWRGDIEAHASRLLGSPVRIGAITVRSSGWVPAIELAEVRVLDAEARDALVLPRVVASLSPRSLLALEVRLAQLYIEAPALEIRRDASGRIRVAGLDFGGQLTADGEGAAADWFLAQHEFVIKGGTVRWIDDTRQDTPPLALTAVDLVVRNGLRTHQLRVDATPPAGWGDRFSLRGRFTQPLFARAADWRRWSGEAYAELPRADIGELRRHLTLPFQLSAGDGALRGWFELKDGMPRRAAVDVALRTVSLRLDESVEPLAFAEVVGRIVAERDGDRTRVAAERFGFATEGGSRWPKGDLAAMWQQREGEPVASGSFTADRLDIGVIAAIAGGVPIGAPLRELLADVGPQGIVTQLATRWEGPLDAPRRYDVQGRLAGLSLKPRAAASAAAVGRPGLRNAAIELAANESGGRARIGVRDGGLELPGVFADPALPLDRFDATLEWAITAPGGSGAAADAPRAITVKVADATFANADARGDFRATWRTGSGNDGAAAARGSRFPGLLELDGRLVDADAVRAARYLPLGIPADVRSYLGAAVKSGRLSEAVVRVRGDLHDFPFHGAKTERDRSEFKVAAKVRDLTFAYVPQDAERVASGGRGWPPLTAGSGEIVIDRSTLQIQKARARIGNVEWRGLSGGIADLEAAARFDIAGDASAPLAEMLRFVAATPISDWIGGVLAEATGSGSAELKLALRVPLADAGKTTVQGSLALGGNDLRIAADTPTLAGARGRVDFSETGFAVVGANARLLGGEIAFEGGAAGGEPPRFSGLGTFSAEGLRRAGELGTLARLASSLNGQAAYRATIAFARGHPQLMFSSNLVGLGVDLPAPLAKAAAAPLALKVQTTVEDGSARPAASASPATATAATHTPADILQIELGTLVAARFVREATAASVRVARGAIRIGDDTGAAVAADRLALPASGVTATLALPRFDADAWLATAERLGAEPNARATGPAPLVFDPAGGGGYLPTTIVLKVGELDLASRRLTDVDARLTQEASTWRAQIEAREIEGVVEYRPSVRGGAGRIHARLKRLSLPKGEAGQVESLLDPALRRTSASAAAPANAAASASAAAPANASTAPASVPSLDIVVDDFELRGKRLGRLEIEATNRGSGGREWRLAKFNLATPEARLVATGAWAPGAAGAPRRAAMDFTLTLDDSGALLERLGIGRVVRGGKGRISGQVSWPGSPLSPDTVRMSGQLKVAIDSGQFLKASPGAGRLLGVLSMQSLPRRLSLDFRDLFAEGFAFDNVTGDVTIEGGVASTNNLRMRGASAVVLMEGDADLERETQALRVVVVPEINAGTASLAFAIINPAVGLGTFLAQYLLRKPIAEAGTREFRVTGAWDDPSVERVERR